MVDIDNPEPTPSIPQHLRIKTFLNNKIALIDQELSNNESINQGLSDGFLKVCCNNRCKELMTKRANLVKRLERIGPTLVEFTTEQQSIIDTFPPNFDHKLGKLRKLEADARTAFFIGYAKANTDDLKKLVLHAL